MQSTYSSGFTTASPRKDKYRLLSRSDRRVGSLRGDIGFPAEFSISKINLKVRKDIPKVTSMLGLANRKVFSRSQTLPVLSYFWQGCYHHAIAIRAESSIKILRQSLWLGSWMSSVSFLNRTGFLNAWPSLGWLGNNLRQRLKNKTANVIH